MAPVAKLLVPQSVGLKMIPEMMRVEDCSRLPDPSDNVAIAVRRLAAGTELVHCGVTFRVAHTVMEGHRFAFRSIRVGEPLLSWGLPFGDASQGIEPGHYICNERILAALAARDIDFALPASPNFVDRFQPYDLDKASIRPSEQVPLYSIPQTFSGYLRDGQRGVGTRNFLIVLGLTSADAAMASAVADRVRSTAAVSAGLCEVVAVTHTEGGGKHRPLNLEFVMRTLAGFVVHPNAGAVLVLDHGAGSFLNQDLETFLRAEGYAIDAVPHQFMRLTGAFEDSLSEAVKVASELRRVAAESERSEQPLSGLRLALQCGGSDAFSGVSGNSLAGWVSKELIRHGGGANLAETDELIGAESYVLQNVRNVDVAVRFLDKIATFKARAERHGASAEGNPSGGNNYRGLYNIALKSLGAARKKDPEVRLDHVLDYGQQMHERGYYFMDSPGNDLESIAGQVATGCNLILFITGNGSITNFPFVPTLKFVTTTGRFELMSNEMDVNAGRYNDGMAMADLGAETFELVRRVASGERTKGEAAGHSQVSIWREWQQQDSSQLNLLRSTPSPTGTPILTAPAAPVDLAFDAYQTERGIACDRIGLVMPTSLCSGQVAELIVADLNARGVLPGGLSKFVALAHTEGCGSANAEELYLQTMVGHLSHPFTQRALLLEHGCEKTHNDAVRHWLAERGESIGDLGFASVQMDGGIEKVRQRVVAWFEHNLAAMPAVKKVQATASNLSVAVMSSGTLNDQAKHRIVALCVGIVAAGGTVVLPDNDGMLACQEFRRRLLQHPESLVPSIAYGEAVRQPGLHIMRMPTTDASETVTGLGGSGVQLMIACVSGARVQGHPMIPMLHVAHERQVQASSDGARDFDVILDSSDAMEPLLERIAETMSGRYVPRLATSGNVRFQLTRGELGVSL